MRDRSLRACFEVLSVSIALAACGGDGKSARRDDSADRDVDKQARCESICDRSAAADCENEAGDCEKQCALLSADTPPHCEAQLSAFMRCAAGAGFTCDADGQSHAPSCEAKLETLIACVQPDNTEAGTPPRIDAGATDASTRPTSDVGLLACPLDDDENACSTCLKLRCCEQISACGTACQALVTCVNGCPAGDTSDACGRACFAAHPGGSTAFTGFARCLSVQCEATCRTGRR